MKRLISFLILTIGLVSCANPVVKFESSKKCSNLEDLMFLNTAKRWLKEHSRETSVIDNETRITQRYYYEIGPQKLSIAVSDLDTNQFLELTEKESMYFNPHFKKETNMKPYLVRAVFANATGRLGVYFSKGRLLISHFSLGSTSTPFVTPLIINLPQKPNQLTLELNSAL